MALINELSRDLFAAESLWLQIDSFRPYIKKGKNYRAACLRRLGWNEWGEGKKIITNLADKCWNVHGVGGEAHPVRHGGLHAQETGHKLVQLLMDAQVSLGNHGENAWSLMFSVFCQPNHRGQQWSHKMQTSGPTAQMDLTLLLSWDTGLLSQHLQIFGWGHFQNSFQPLLLCNIYIYIFESTRLNIHGADCHFHMTDGGPELIWRIDGIVIFHLMRCFNFLLQKMELWSISPVPLVGLHVWKINKVSLYFSGASEQYDI